MSESGLPTAGTGQTANKNFDKLLGMALAMKTPLTPDQQERQIHRLTEACTGMSKCLEQLADAITSQLKSDDPLFKIASAAGQYAKTVAPMLLKDFKVRPSALEAVSTETVVIPMTGEVHSFKSGEVEIPFPPHPTAKEKPTTHEDMESGHVYVYRPQGEKAKLVRVDEFFWCTDQQCYRAYVTFAKDGRHDVVKCADIRKRGSEVR